MSSYKEIDNAVETFNKFDCPFELMHCVSKYPFEAEHASLNLIDELRKGINVK